MSQSLSQSEAALLAVLVAAAVAHREHAVALYAEHRAGHPLRGQTSVAHLADPQTDRQTERQTERQTDSQTDR